MMTLIMTTILIVMLEFNDANDDDTDGYIDGHNVSNDYYNADPVDVHNYDHYDFHNDADNSDDH